MKKFILFCWMQLPVIFVMAQPYVDPIQVRYTYAFNANRSRGTPFSHLWVGSDLPVKVKNKTYLLFSPYYENWQIDSGSVHHLVPSIHGIVLPVGLLFPFKNKKWSMLVSAIVRSNAEKLFGNNTFQYGGAGFVSYEKSPGKKIRLGIYMNSDLFGFFFMPLLGADWQMNKNNYFFGLLPGRFTWEHKISPGLYTGLTFRAITNSYRLKNGQYVRIDDNQLSAFIDAYPAKKICVSLEPGYGILRQLRTGTEKRKYFNNDNWADGWFVKLSAAYRIRLSK